MCHCSRWLGTQVAVIHRSSLTILLLLIIEDWGLTRRLREGVPCRYYIILIPPCVYASSDPNQPWLLSNRHTSIIINLNIISGGSSLDHLFTSIHFSVISISSRNINLLVLCWINLIVSFRLLPHTYSIKYSTKPTLVSFVKMAVDLSAVVGCRVQRSINSGLSRSAK